MTKKKIKTSKIKRRNGRRGYQAKKQSTYLKYQFKSKFEERVKDSLEAQKVAFTYETESVEYTQVRKYKPDFILKDPTDPSRMLIIEAKGLFDSEDRRKHLDVQKQHPELDIRFVFYADHKLRKGAKSRYSDWCQKNNFKYAIKSIPESWLKEFNLLPSDSTENNSKEDDNGA